MSAYRPISQISRIVIHCAATPNGRPNTAADVNQWHRDHPKIKFRRADDARFGRGKWAGKGLHASELCCIGYHFVVRVNGVVEVGRRLTETGAHEVKANKDGIGIMLFGTDQFTPAQWKSLRILVLGLQRDRKQLLGDKIPELDILGHRQLKPSKLCPGFDVPAWVEGGMQPLEGHIFEGEWQ